MKLISNFLPLFCMVDWTYRLNNIVNQLLGLVDLVLGFGHDETVEIFFLIAIVSSVRATFAFLDGAFASNGNLSSRLGLHLFECVTTRSDK